MPRVVYRERIPTASRTPYPLGRNIHHDSASRLYPFVAPSRQLVSVRWPRRIEVLDQGDLGSCTGQAGIGCMGTDPFYWTVDLNDEYHVLNEADAVALYSAATGADDFPGRYPPDDTGSDGLTIAKVLTAVGEISGYRHAFTLEDALAALQVGPVLTGVPWYQDMFSPAPSGLLSITGALAGGHEVVVDEIDTVKAMVGITNSWSSSWGLAGRAYLRIADWGTLLSQQGDVTVLVPSTMPPPTPTPPPPGPVANNADRTLARTLGNWPTDRHVGANSRAAAAVRVWKRSLGL